MELAIQQAKKAAERDEIPVGAIIQDASGKIIAKDGKVISEAAKMTEKSKEKTKKEKIKE